MCCGALHPSDDPGIHMVTRKDPVSLHTKLTNLEFREWPFPPLSLFILDNFTVSPIQLLYSDSSVVPGVGSNLLHLIVVYCHSPLPNLLLFSKPAASLFLLVHPITTVYHSNLDYAVLL